MESNDLPQPDERDREARQKRFGSLPARVLPSDTAESTDTRNIQDRPASAMNPNQVAALFDGA